MTSTAHDPAGVAAAAAAGAAASAAVDALLDLDLGLMDDAAVHELLVAEQRLRARLGVASAGALAEWDQRKVWLNNGSRRPAHRFARETRSSVATGRDELARARLLEVLPHTRQAVLDGTSSWDHADLFARVCTRERLAMFIEHEEAMVAHCVGVPFWDAVIRVNYWKAQADERLAAERDRPAETETSKLYASKALDDRGRRRWSRWPSDRQLHRRTVVDRSR